MSAATWPSGASLGGLGLVVAPLARRLVGSGSVARNYLIMAVVVAGGLIGVAYRWDVWGFVFMFPLGAAMMALGYMVSYYLNALADSSRRATVLSFKGVAFNLGYGFVSLVFAVLLRAVREGGDVQEAVGCALTFLPACLGGLRHGALPVAVLAAWLHIAASNLALCL